MGEWQPYIRDPASPCAACRRSYCQVHPVPGSSMGWIRTDDNTKEARKALGMPGEKGEQS